MKATIHLLIARVADSTLEAVDHGLDGYGLFAGELMAILKTGMRSLALLALSGVLVTGCDSRPVPPNQLNHTVSFFGIESKVNGPVVYVLDHGGSMLDSFDDLRAEIKRSVATLPAGTQYAVVCFSEEVDAIYPQPGRFAKAGQEQSQNALAWLDTIRAQGEGCDLENPPVNAIKAALALRPALVYFLIDGNFEPAVVEKVTTANARQKAVINTLAFVKITRDAEGYLKQIAHTSGGQYKFVSEKELDAAQKR